MDKQNTIQLYKRNEVLIHGTIQMNLENIMLSGRCQSQKDKHCMIPLEMSSIGKSIQTETCMQLHTGAQIVNVLNASEFFTVKWLIPCYIHFTSIKKKRLNQICKVKLCRNFY